MIVATELSRMVKDSSHLVTEILTDFLPNVKY